jgi:hypothetical protein
MFSFITRKVEVLSHWIAFIDFFNISSLGYYDLVEEELKLRKVPGLKAEKVEFSEGGLLSDQRTYLRLVRERLVFDVCASPMGTGYFFSCRSFNSCGNSSGRAFRDIYFNVKLLLLRN